ncbi:glucan phosphoethanolaminetransferase (alkaline phosphatase superfamily) [Metabacillus crassostreae]|nr:glucan phosphoethanolaminetransferase (alkaline phosphatase superfamily) [Metabacillus crassostreae]
MSLLVNILIVFISFYFFCLCSAHVFMYKPDLQLLKHMKKRPVTFLFSILGLAAFYLLKKLKLSGRWFYPAYMGLFIFLSTTSFIMMVSSI